MNVVSADKLIHIQGLALRLYNPESHRLSIYWANAADGISEQNPMVGQFSNGRGEFYNQQIYEGRAIYARFVWSGVTTDSPHFEQAFYTDGEKPGSERTGLPTKLKRSRRCLTRRSRDTNPGFDQRIENAHVDRAGGTGAQQETALVDVVKKCLGLPITCEVYFDLAYRGDPNIYVRWLT